MKLFPGRYWSSWGCVQVFILTLAILKLSVLVSALESGIDLLQALNIHANFSQYIGVSITQGFNMKYAYRLISEEKLKRNLVLPLATCRRTAELIHRSTEFTFAATVRQEELNSGSIISFSDGNNRYLELQSSGRKNEIRFHYTSLSTSGNLLVHTESFPYRLADNKWHKIALSISGTEIQLLIDCHPLYRREIHYIPDRNFSASDLKLFVGQRNIYSQFQFKGDIEEARIITGSHGYLRQCPDTNTQCPTCGEFGLLQDTVVELRQHVIQLTQRLVAAESSILLLEQCDCKKSCKINNTFSRYDGERWYNKCDTCTCNEGEIICKKNCGELLCKFPKIVEDECCPKCLGTCLLKGRTYEHGEYTLTNCKNCTCIDGNMNCRKYDCPVLTCPPSKQMKIIDGCCNFCPGEDYCSKGHVCHYNATCLNLSSKYTCKCVLGFQGDGMNCTDIDECAEQGDLLGNHCHQNTKCVNTHGSYICECLTGYRRVDKFNCAEIDECTSDLHDCHENAMCINTLGSYQCKCKDGYYGNGFNCTPICNTSCSRNGVCTSPGICTCNRGYYGISCEYDLDECETDLHICKDSEICINMPGWYDCKCKPGYEKIGHECTDINECQQNTHSCHKTAKCINTDGHFECHCDEYDLNCRLSCIFEDMEIMNGEIISPENQPCKKCSCNRGIISCEDIPCNCSTWQSTGNRDICCAKCDPKENCQHQELKHIEFKSGERWIYQCETCECLYGELDCWKLECPPLACDNPLPLAPGDCCPRCDDPCSFSDNVTNDAIGKPCPYKGHTYTSGRSFSDLSSPCTTCACKDGQLCCSFDNNCIENVSPKSNNIHQFSTIKNRNNYSTSKTKTSTTQRLQRRYSPTAATSKTSTKVLSKSRATTLPNNLVAPSLATLSSLIVETTTPTTISTTRRKSTTSTTPRSTNFSTFTSTTTTTTTTPNSFSSPSSSTIFTKN